MNLLIYITKSIRSIKYENVNSDLSDFEYIANYSPDVFQGDKKNIKNNKAFYFLAGELKNNTRANDNFVSKSLICLDYDEIETTIEDFTNAIHDKLKPYNYIIYPTISNTSENPRMRLVIEPNRSFFENEGKLIVQSLINTIAILPCDSASKTWSQHMGLKIVVNESVEDYKSNIVINRGKSYPIDNLLQVVEIKEKEQQNKPNSKAKALNPKSTYATMQGFCMREESNLQEYSYYINCILVLAKSVQQGEISKENGIRYAEMLALDNEEWKKSSLEDIEREISNSNLKTDVTFMQRFSKNGDQDPILDTLECANQLLAEKYFLVVGTDDDAPLYLYDENKGIYTNSSFYMQKIAYEKENRYNEYNIRDVLFKIKMKCDRKRPENNRYLIPCANGIYDLQKHTLLPFSPDYVFTNSIGTSYIENAPKPSWDIDNWLLSIANNDEDIVTLLWQVIAECLNGNYTRGKFFILTGNGNNGKGSFEKLLINLIGEENVSSLKWKKITERFSPYSMVGKTLNIGDDIEGSYIEDNSIVQSIVTGDTITVEQKGKDPFSTSLKLGLVFSANEIPKVRNKTNGLYRRMCIIPFNADFNGQIQDRSIKDEKLNNKEVLEYVLNKALQLEFTNFIEPEAVKEKLEDYKQSNDPILEFYTTYLKDVDTDRFPIPFIYAHYKDFCKENGFKPVSTRNFTTGLGDYLGKGWEKGKARVSSFQDTDYCIEVSSSLVDYLSTGFDFSKTHNSFSKK